MQWRNERPYNSPRLLLKYFLIAGKETLEGFILSNPDTYLYNRQLEAKAKELKHLWQTFIKVMKDDRVQELSKK